MLNTYHKIAFAISMSFAPRKCNFSVSAPAVFLPGTRVMSDGNPFDNFKLIFPKQLPKTGKKFKRKYELILPKGEIHYFTNMKKMWAYIKLFREHATRFFIGLNDKLSTSYKLIFNPKSRMPQKWSDANGVNFFQLGNHRTAVMTVRSMRTGATMLVPVTPRYVEGL